MAKVERCEFLFLMLQVGYKHDLINHNYDHIPTFKSIVIIRYKSLDHIPDIDFLAELNKTMLYAYFLSVPTYNARFYPVVIWHTWFVVSWHTFMPSNRRPICMHKLCARV